MVSTLDLVRKELEESFFFREKKESFFSGKEINILSGIHKVKVIEEYRGR